MQDLLGMMHAMFWNYNTSHWQTKGNNYYGNHLLFKRLYETMDDEFDVLAEKMVGYFGVKAVNQPEIIKRSQRWIKRWSKIEDHIDRGVTTEKEFQQALKQIYKTLKEGDDLTLGLDDYLMATANTHETHLYLLTQASKS